MQEGDEAGIMKSEDAADELVRLYPDLAPSLPLYFSVIKGGERVQSVFPGCYGLE